MRPRGSIRKAVTEHVAAAEAGASWRDLAQKLEASGLIDTRAPSELALVRRAVENMKRTGELEPVGEQRTRWSRRPLKLYGARKAQPSSPRADAMAELSTALGLWAVPPE